MPVQRLLAILLALAALLLPRLAFAATYAARAEPYNWISTGGHSNASWGGGCSGAFASVDDDITAELPLGFTFTFGGTGYTTARIMSNGRLQFGNTYCGNGTAVTTPRTYPLNYPDANVVRTMRIYGADFDSSLGGTVTYKAIGSSPNRQFVVTWTNIQEWGVSGSKFNLQVVLNENGEFVYQFGAITNVSGGKAQIGWELSTADYGLYTYASAGALASTAIRWGLPKSVLSGTVFEDVNYGGGAGRSLSASGGIVINGATVELYNSSGAFVSSTSTNSSGTYSFTVSAAGTYHVRVASITVRSTRSGGSSAVPVMTYRATGTSGAAVAQTDFVGGTNPSAADPATASSGATFNTSTYVYGAGLSGTAHAVAPVTPTLGTDVAGLDFGFNFDTVTNVNDSGQGSLRQAITNANTLGGDNALAQAGRTAGVETLIFMISNGSAAAGLRSSINYSAGSVASIAVASALPAVTNPLAIDATTQPGYSTATYAPLVEVNGAATAAGIAGLVLSANNCVAKGLVINRFGGNGITLSSGTSGHAISGNYIGTNSAGAAASANGGHGVYVQGSASTVGGTTAGSGNLLSGNSGSGVYVNASSTTITGNLIGTNAAGTAAVGNQYGVRALSATSLTLGGTAAASGNTISGNSSHGVYFEGGNVTAVLQGNRIGRNSANSGTVANGGNGVHVFNSSSVTGLTGATLGGTAAGAGNTIAGNSGSGVALAAGNASQVAVLGNSIYGNGGLGIDLGADGITTNNGSKSGGQPNQLMDYPVFTAASVSGTTLTVSGYVGSAAGQPAFSGSRVEIFLSDAAQANGNGQTYLGFLTADSSGNFSGSIAVSGVTLTNGNSRITGTATDAGNNTSEFGPNALVGLMLSGTVFEDLNYGGGAGRNRATSAGIAVAGATVELYDSTGAYVSSTTTASGGTYSFTVGSGTHHVRVVSASVRSTRSGSSSAALGVMTFRTDASGGSALDVTNFVGGTDTAAADPGAASSGTAFNTSSYVFSAGLSGTAHAVSKAVVGSASIAGLDFGWNFDTVSNSNDSGQGSLRQAVTNANTLGGDSSLAQSGRTAGAESLVFMISNGSASSGLRSTLNHFSSGVGSISLLSALPAITTSMVLDAQTQPGWTAAPVVELNGNSAGAAADGLSVQAAGVTIRGFVINRFKASGIAATAAATGLVVQGNYIGTTAAGTAASANSSSGVTLTGTPGALIGGTSASQRNVISGNTKDGITATGATVTGTLIQGNYIGLSAAGTAAVANGPVAGTGMGIRLLTSATGVTIGGSVAGAGNVVSGNGYTGIDIYSGSHTIQGNIVGLNAAGTATVANGATGIALETPTAGASQIGGTTALARNVVSGNALEGIYIGGNAASSTVVQGNYVGTDITGTLARSNGRNGAIYVAFSANNIVIGGTAAGAGNLISGNSSVAQGGVVLATGSGHHVQGNTIGLSATGAALPNGNAAGTAGVYIFNGAATSTIGGTASGAGNVIASNTGAGVAVLGSSTGHAIQRNSIYGNGGPGIDLALDGATANDGAKSASQPNLLMDKPVLTAATLGSSTLSVVGYVGSAALQTTFGAALVDVYISDGSNASGKTWVGTLTANADGEFAGVLSTAGLSGLVAGTTRVTATATDASGNTGEFTATLATTALAALQNGGFETGTSAGSTFIMTVTGDSSSLPSWVVTGNSIDVIGGFWQSAEGTRSLDMSGGARGGVAQAVQTVPGQTYGLRFAMATNAGCGTATKVLRVSALGSGQTTSQTYSLSTSGRSNAAMGWQDQVLSFTAASESTVLWFESLEVSACGPTLDNVRLGGGGAGSVAGTVFEDRNYGGGAGRNRATALAAGGAARPNARVELYTVSGSTATYFGTTSTDSSGAYRFSNLPAGSYLVRVQSSTVTSSRSGAVAGLLPVPTFMTDASSGAPADRTDHVGGPAPAVTAAATLAGTTGGTTTLPVAYAEATSTVTVAGAAITGVDFGFNFDTVTNTNDSGAGSLRQVITNANTLGGDTSLAVSGRTAGVEHVIFMLSNGTASSGLRAANNLFTTTAGNQAVAALAPASPLPPITSTLTLDAQTQPGWSSVPVIDIDGVAAGTGSTVHGLTVNAASSTVRGFVLRRFAQSGLSISGAAVTVQGNHIGTNPAGTVAAGNGYSGISSSGTGTVIGGTTSSQRNLVSGNALGMVLTASGAVVTGNYVGTTVSGNAKLPNTAYGIGLTASGTVRIGGTTVAERNVIGGNGTDGIFTTGTPTIQGNWIGLGADGSTALGNARNGVWANCASPGTVGGTVSGAGNVIANNGASGVLVSAACSALSIRGNSIYGNTKLAIDLGETSVGSGVGNGSTANDGAKTAGQANQLMDTPVFTNAALSGSTLTLTGYVGSAAGQAVFAGSQVDVFVADTAGTTPSGRTWLGVVTADASGNLAGTVTLPASVAFTAGSTSLTGTATDASGNSSEFGPKLVYGRAISGKVFEDIHYGGGAGRSAAASGGVGVPAAVVELIGSDGVLLASTTSAADGSYSFSGTPPGHHIVRVVQSSVRSTRSGSNASLLGVQTWRQEASWTGPGPITDEVGGADPAATDGSAGVASYAWTACAVENGTCSFTGTRLVRYGDGTTWTTRVLSGGTACTNVVFGDPLVGTAKACQILNASLHSASSASTLAGDLTGVDFGFNFDTVVNTNDSGAGSLRQVISNANALGGDASLAVSGRSAGIEHVIFMLGNGSSAPGLRSAVDLFSGGVATFSPRSALPAITAPLAVDAQQQPGWASTPVLQLSGGSAGAGADGLTLSSATGSTVRGLAINGFSRFGLSLTTGNGHVVAGNHVGTNAAGTAAAGNGTVGVNLWTVSGSTIGGSAAADRNVIAGNGNSGVVIGGAGGTGNVVRGNHIGVNVTGSARLANGAQGVYVASGGTQFIGNVISGNTWENVLLDVGADGSLLTGNTIGPDGTGSTALPNTGSGVKLMSKENVIGGTTPALRNVIAGNGGDGILISGATASGNAVQGNHIGVNTAGTGLVPNSGAGVRLQADASGNTVGGPGAGNLIRGNAAAGVVVTGAGSNRISRNAIWGNGQIGIDLADNGASTNDGAKTSGQPNQLMDSAVITSARARGNQLSVNGYVGSAVGQSLFAGATVEVFVSDNHGSGFGSGQTWLGTLTADASGAFSGTLTMPVAALALGTRLTATATDGSGNTSEFGPNFNSLVVDFMVNTTADDNDLTPGDGQCLTAAGLCSLRAAITELNAWTSLSSTPTVAFALPGCSTAGQPACSIAPTTALPTVARAMVIDGSTQPGWSSSTAAPLVELSGATAPANAIGLVVNTNGFTLRGLVVNRWGSHGLSLGGSGNVVAGNWFGLNASGSAAAGNGGNGIDVTGSNQQIGGSTGADRNVASGNGGAGIALKGSGNTVTGNVAGLLPDGSGAAGNVGDGIYASAAKQTIGGGTGYGNVASANLRSGVRLDVGADNSVVQGNCIGVAADCSTARGNGYTVGSPSSGVGVVGGAGSLISGNVIAYSANAGVGFGAVVQMVSILGNSIHGNAGEGIRLNIADANDGAYNSAQSNRGMDNPVITGAGIDGTGTAMTVFGYIGTGTGQAAFAGARVEFFRAAPDSSGFGEGKVYLGSLTADGNGRFSGTISIGAGQAVVGDTLTGTATDSSGNTSEFGPNWVATTVDALTPAGFNAFETDTPAAAISGVIRSKVAGTPVSLAVVALDTTGLKLHPGFTGTVSLTWVDARDDSGATSGSCRSSWVGLGAAGSVSFSASSRMTVAVTPPATGTRSMRLKMSYSVAGRVVDACSSDAFAALPASLTLVASDSDSSTAGTTRTLDTTSASTGAVHQAGRPFTVVSRALDTTGALMTGYNGTPTLASVGCLLPAGCTAGALTSPPSAATAGVMTNNLVSYAEVGALSLQLTDADYAAVDSADTLLATRTIQSGAVAVGRFVPDSLLVTVSAPGTLATANGACMASGQGATFIGQGFGWATAPQVTVTARNAAGGTTASWTGPLMKLTGGAQGPALAAASAGTATLASSFGSIAVTDLGGGMARLDASGSDRFLLDLPAGSVQPTVTPSWTWSLKISDASEAGVSGNPLLSALATQSPIPFDRGAAFHSGRLALSAAHGDARMGVRSLVQLQRWSDAGWVTLTEDRGCVTVQPRNLGVESPSGVFASSGDCAAPMTTAATTSGGRAWLSLPATPGAEPGRLALRLAGAAASGHSCSAAAASDALVALGQPWLLGGTGGSGPTALATWGRPNRDVVLRRETW